MKEGYIFSVQKLAQKKDEYIQRKPKRLRSLSAWLKTWSIENIEK